MIWSGPFASCTNQPSNAGRGSATQAEAAICQHGPYGSDEQSSPAYLLITRRVARAAVVVVYLTAIRLTDDRQRLRIDRLTMRG
jgi:hypothetical protein